MRQRIRIGRIGMAGVTLGCLLLGGCSRWLDSKSDRLLTGSLRSLERQENREALRRLLTSPEIEASTRALTQAVLDTAWDDLSREERRARARELAAELVEAAGPALGRILDRDVLPRVREELAASLQAAVERAFTDENRRKAQDFASGVARAALTAAQDEIARSIQAGVAAGIDAGFERSLNGRILPAVHRAFDGSEPAFARAVRTGTESALLGAADALHGELGAVLREDRQAFLRELQAVAATERQAWLAQLQAQVEQKERRWKNWFLILAAVAGVAMLVAGIWLSRLLKENRRLKAA
ncbi:MAG TPA: hypothetical protein VGX68_08125 [Thermoanaerobaculia bacterium]|jgi:hypothetical protein|nr:hypothetical protein [Thermoanaerobaculia bacterium]